MLKGLATVTLVLLLLFLVMFVGLAADMLWVGNDSLKQRSMMNANEIAGVINLLQASPSGTFHVVELDKGCTVEINSDSVAVYMQSNPAVPTAKLLTLKQAAKAGIIKTSLNIEPARLECKDGNAYIMRCSDTIKTSQKTKPCEQ